MSRPSLLTLIDDCRDEIPREALHSWTQTVKVKYYIEQLLLDLASGTRVSVCHSPPLRVHSRLTDQKDTRQKKLKHLVADHRISSLDALTPIVE